MNDWLLMIQDWFADLPGDEATMYKVGTIILAMIATVIAQFILKSVIKVVAMVVIFIAIYFWATGQPIPLISQFVSI